MRPPRGDAAAERRAGLFLLLTTGIWGATFFSMQLWARAVEAIAPPGGAALIPLDFLALRFAIAALLFPAVFPRVLRRMSASVWRDSFYLALPFLAGFVLQISALQGTDSAIVAFLTSLTVVFTPLLGWLVFRERLTTATLAGAGLALVGVFVLTNPVGGQFRIAELLALLSSIAFALHVHLTNILTRRSDPEGITLGMFVWVCALSAGALAAFPAGRTMLAPEFVRRSLEQPHGLWSLLFNATLASVVAIWIMNRFQRDVLPTRAVVIYSLEPVFAAVFAALFVHEPMTASKIAGGAIILAGNLVCEALRRGSTPPAT